MGILLLSLCFIGNAFLQDEGTPKEVVESPFKALIVGDVETFATYMDDDRLASKEKQLESYKDNLRTSSFIDFEIMESNKVSDSFFEVIVEIEYADGAIDQLPAKVKRIDNQWKITYAEYEPGEVEHIAEAT
ncbi:DUF4878 domain-containing protein [Gracilibacillus orientalis]|uniref:DUF4878 domain-containing protein n=1 Tax=Gracilibacillus orientalis TaxID=334253 RepID=UPI0015870698|nr:DUF4878 domain-containing protein [Gracilibacillus orientalis]